MIVPRAVLFVLLALLAVLAPAAAAAPGSQHKVFRKNPLQLAQEKLLRQAKEAQKHYEKHGVYPKHTSADSAALRAEFTTKGSKSDYVVTYSYADDKCSDDAVVAAASMPTDYCSPAEPDDGISGFFTKAECTSDGVFIGLYIGACKTEQLFLAATIKSEDLGKCYYHEVPVDGDDDDDDDGDFDDDDAFLPESYASVVCENKVRYGFDTAPALAHYAGVSCEGRQTTTEYFKETTCTTTDGTSGSVTCKDGKLVVNNYDTPDCTGTPSPIVSQDVDKCIVDPLSDDDDDDDDDDDTPTTSQMASCNAENLPNTDAAYRTSGGVSIVLALAACVAAMLAAIY